MRPKAIAVVSLFTGGGMAIGYALFVLVYFNVPAELNECGWSEDLVSPLSYCGSLFDVHMIIASIALIAGTATSFAAFKLGFMRPDSPLGVPRSA